MTEYQRGVEDTIAYFHSQFDQWRANQYGARVECLTFDEMLADARRKLLHCIGFDAECNVT